MKQSTTLGLARPKNAVKHNQAHTQFAHLLIGVLLAAPLAAQEASSGAVAPTKKATIEVLDTRHYPASNFLAYTEFELSGEPLAEALGLDLDLLDPTQLNQPTVFDYAAGIESYEYSEEAMYALNYQSTMGLSLISGPRNRERQLSMNTANAADALQLRIAELAESVGYPVHDMPKNMALISLPFLSGLPEFAQKPSLGGVKAESFDMLDAQGVTHNVQTIQPDYLSDFASLAWDAKSFEQVLNPAASGGILLKEIMWAQDFLGGMHEQESDEEVEAESATMDQDGKYRLGVSIADGFNGMLLMEQALDKLTTIQSSLLYDGQQLGAKLLPNYRADAKNLIWMPHKIEVAVNRQGSVTELKTLKVSDAGSSLRDVWQMLWPLAELYAMSDQRVANRNQNPAFKAVFDGKPFAPAPDVNIDQSIANDVAASDAFSLANNLLNLTMQNLQALHFNQQHGTFVESVQIHSQKGSAAHISQNNSVSAFDAAYTLVALGIYQRAVDALPVGYAAGDNGSDSLQTEAGKQALALIKAQADFILKHMLDEKGLVIARLDLNTLAKRQQDNAVSAHVSLDAQFAVIRGLASAFVSTKDARYREAARKLYHAVDTQLFDPALGTWAQGPGKATIHTPYTAAAISGALRELMLRLKNIEGERIAALELQLLVQRYNSWFKTVINGGLQLSEALMDTGEHVLAGVSDPALIRDSDRDGVPKSVFAGKGNGLAPVLAAGVRVQSGK